jgi:ribosomal protein S4E
MPSKEIIQTSANKLVDGALCKVVGGTHAGKSGTVRDINTSKGGNITITVVQANGVRFKTLGKNVEVVTEKGWNTRTHPPRLSRK